MPIFLAAALIAIVPCAVALVIAGARSPERVVLPIYAAAAPFGSGAALPLGLPRQFTSVSSLLLLILLLGLVVQLTLYGSDAQRPALPTPAWLAMLALLIASAAWSVNSRTTLQALPIIASLIVLYALLAQRQVSPDTVRLVGNGALLGGVAAACYGIYGAATGTLQAADTASPRFGSDLLGANHTAAALMLPFALALWRCVDAPTSRTRLLYLPMVGLVVAAIALTGSRGGIIALGATYVTVTMHGRRPARALAGGAVLGAAILAASFYSSAGIGARDTASSSGRLDIWRIGLAACPDYCLQGSGWGTFPEVYGTYAPSVTSAKVLRRGTAFESHNVPLQLLVETGLVGLLLFLLGFALALRQAWRIPRSLRGPPLGALVGLLVTSCLLSNFEFKYFWLVLTYATLCAVSAPRRDRLTGSPLRSSASLVGPITVGGDS